MSKIITYHRFIPVIKKEFPGLTDKQIEMIIHEGCFKMHNLIVNYRKDLVLKNNFKKFSITLFRFVSRATKLKFKLNGNSQKPVSESQSGS